MGMAWADGYWIDNSISGTPRLTFEIPTSGTGSTTWPWLDLAGNFSFAVIKQQLDTANVFIRWNDSTKQITRITARKPYY